LSARHGSDRLRHLLVGDPDGRRELPGLGLRLVATLRLELRFEAGKATNEPITLLAVGLRHRSSYVLHPKLDGPDVARCQHPLQRGGIGMIQLREGALL
jgi:hypothetical protein